MRKMYLVLTKQKPNSSESSPALSLSFFHLLISEFPLFNKGIVFQILKFLS